MDRHIQDFTLIRKFLTKHIFLMIDLEMLLVRENHTIHFFGNPMLKHLLIRKTWDCFLPLQLIQNLSIKTCYFYLSRALEKVTFLWGWCSNLEYEHQLIANAKINDKHIDIVYCFQQIFFSTTKRNSKVSHAFHKPSYFTFTKFKKFHISHPTISQVELKKEDITVELQETLKIGKL